MTDLKPAPPSPSLLINEVFSWLELPRLLLHSPALARMPRGRGEPILVVPGFGAGDFSTLPLRRYLDYLGYSVSGWQLGLNNGQVVDTIDALQQQVYEHWQRSGTPLSLIGWSLGGYLAREVARELPGCVTQVITLGSPVVGGPKYTRVSAVYVLQGADLDAIERAVAERNRVPLTTPVTAIYSRNDGVVSWQACIDQESAHVEHVEVNASHLGLGVSADVYRIIAQRLAAAYSASE